MASDKLNSIKNFFSIHDKFEKHGLHVKEIPKGVVVFKVISWTSFFTTLGICYKFKPTSTFLKTKFGQNSVSYLKTKYPNVTTKFTNKTTNLTKKMSENSFFKRIPDALGLKATRFSKALVENAVLYKLSLPLTLPLYLYWTVKYVKWSRKSDKTS